MITENIDILEALDTVADIVDVDTAGIEQLLQYYKIGNSAVCNLNSSIVIEAEPAAFEIFHLTTSMFWPQISYLIYETTGLAWLLQRLNHTLTTNCFAKVEAPNHIRYLPNADTVIASLPR